MCIYVSLATNPSSPSGISCIQNWFFQNKFVRLEVYLPGDWLKCGFPLCAIYNIAHLPALILPFVYLSPSVLTRTSCLLSVFLSILYLKHLWVDWHLYFGNRWWNEQMRDCDSRKILLYNFKKSSISNCHINNEFILVKLFIKELLLHQIAWTGPKTSFRLYWNDF